MSNYLFYKKVVMKQYLFLIENEDGLKDNIWAIAEDLMLAVSQVSEIKTTKPRSWISGVLYVEDV